MGNKKAARQGSVIERPMSGPEENWVAEIWLCLGERQIHGLQNSKEMWSLGKWTEIKTWLYIKSIFFLHPCRACR